MSIQALADSLGISISTVSRALNGYTDVSAATRARVMEAAKAMNYAPHPVAHRLATGKTGAVAIVSPTRDGRTVDNSMAALHLSVSHALREQGYFTLSVVLAGGDQELVELDRLIAARLVDAMVLTRTRTFDVRVQRLQECKIPFLTYGRTLENTPHAWVDWDYEQATTQAVVAMVAHGHRRIALVNGMAHMSFASLIESSFYQALEAAGISRDASPVHYTDLTGMAGLHAARELFSGSHPPTAILCASDALAIGVCAAARQQGLRVGADVSVVGYGNTEASQLTEPALSSIHQDLMAQGRLVAQHLLALLGGESVNNLQTRYATQLIERASLGSALAR
jgi:LacI family transcriptional regulator